MNIHKYSIIFAFAFFALMPVKAKVEIVNNAVVGAFPIASANEAAKVFVSPSEHVLVGKVARMFVSDVDKVVGYKPELKQTNKVVGRRVVVVGSLGNNAFIDKLVKQKKLNVTPIKNGWEQYIIQQVSKPVKGIDEALVVVGSDKRGAAYGLLSISEKMGVSPYY